MKRKLHSTRKGGCLEGTPPLTIQVAFFRTCRTKDGGTNVPLADILDGISNGKWSKQIKKLRALEFPSEAYDSMKPSLPCIMLSATTSDGSHRKTGLGPHTGIMQIDVDKLSSTAEAISLRDKLAADPHILATWLSPGARGTKGAIFIPVPADEAGHRHAFAAVEAYMRTTYGVEIDPACKNINRLCIVSHDPDLRLNQNAIPLPITPVQMATKMPGKSGGKRETAYAHSSISLNPKSCILYNNDDFFNDFPELRKHYLEHVTKPIGTPQRGMRNAAIVEITSRCLFVVHPRFVIDFVKEFHREHADVFAGYPVDLVVKEAESLIANCEASFRNELTPLELGLFELAKDDDEKSAFRICRSLAQCTSNPQFPPPTFHLSAHELGIRLGKFDPQADRILKLWATRKAIEIVNLGTKHTKGLRGRATSYRWVPQ